MGGLMGLAGRTRSALAVALFAVAVSAHSADCVSSYILLSQAGFQPNHPVGPVAWNGSVLAVARATTGVPVTLSLYDGNMVPVTSETTVTTSSLGHSLKLLTNGSKFALIFFTTAGTIALQEISPNGTPLGAERRLATSHGVFQSQELDATYNAAAGLWEVLYTIPANVDTGLWLTTIPANSAGAITDVRLQTSITPGQTTPRIAAAANRTIAVGWHRPLGAANSYFVALYDQSLLFANALIVVSSNLQSPVLTSPGNNTFALLYQGPVSGGTELRWVRFNTTGAITNADARLLIGSGIDVEPVSLLWNPTLAEWAVTYLDQSIGATIFPGEYRIRRLTSSAAVISDTLFTPDANLAVVGGRYPIATSGTAYFGSIERFYSVAEGSDSYLVKHCPLDAAAKAVNATPVARQPFTFTATASGGVPPYAYTWDFGDFSEPRHERTFNHAYERTGTYTVTLTVTDFYGDKAVRTLTVTVVDTIRRRTTKR
jgi:PKD repeat protein